MEGRPFGRYRLIELLGHGGMGDVWRAYDVETQRVVALKVLRANLASDPQFERRFRREAFAAAGVADPHVVPIHSFGEIDGQLYVDMRLIEGRDLQTLLKHGPLEPGRAVRIVAQVASALHAAHRVGLLHRDVKPSNILITEDDFAYLIDFGIARSSGQSGLTGTGQVIGTFAYLAPERLTGGRDDSRADIYALACVLHECLTGVPPFPGNTLEQQIAAHLSVPPPRPSSLRPGLPIALDAVIATGLAKNPDERYATTREMAQAAQTAITVPTAAPPVLPSEVHPAQRFAPQADRAPRSMAGPPHHMAARSGPSPEAATQYRPFSPAAEATGTTQRKRNVVAITGAIGAIAVVAVLGVVAAFATGGHSESAPVTTPLPTTTSPPPNTGPFTGTYSADFGPNAGLNGAPYEGATPTQETWEVRSACGTSGCVATASRWSGSTSVQELVFDQVGDSWIAVRIESGTCQRLPNDQFNTIVLRPQPDGRLTGEFFIESTNGCFDQHTVAFTRTGDTDITGLPDPITQPPRVVSPAEALYGQYHFRRESTVGHKPQDYNYGVQTHCLRAGDRCISMFRNADTLATLVAENGAWSRNEEYNADGPACGPSRVKVTGTYPLPDPPQNPITRLTGRTSQTESSDRCTNSDFVETFERTGD